MEHDFYVGISLAIVLTAIVKKVGPDFGEMLDKELDAQEKVLRNVRQKEIDHLLQSIENEKVGQANGIVFEDVIAAKKEAVGLQLEAAYRQRLSDAYTQVKKRLDYQLEVSNVKRRLHSRNVLQILKLWLNHYFNNQ